MIAIHLHDNVGAKRSAASTASSTASAASATSTTSATLATPTTTKRLLLITNQVITLTKTINNIINKKAALIMRK